MLPLTVAVALLGATQVVEKWVSRWILATYPAERELLEYTNLADDPTCLSMARATEVVAAALGETISGDAVAPERCPQLSETHAIPSGRVAQLVAPQRLDSEVRSSLDAVRAALSDVTMQKDLDALGLEVALSRAGAFVGDGMVHLTHTRDFGRDVVRPWLCADATVAAVGTTLDCTEVAKVWRQLVALSSWGVTLWFTRLSIRTGRSALCVRGLLYHALSRLWRCAVVLCTTLPLADHRCRLLHHAVISDGESSGTLSSFAALDEELAACVEQFMRFRATLALTIAVLAASAILPTSESGKGERSVRPCTRHVQRLACAVAIGVLVLGTFGESVAMIGHTADAVGGLIMMPAIWWVSGALAELVRAGRPVWSASMEHLDREQRESNRRQLAWLWLGCGGALPVILSHRQPATAHDEFWYAPLRGWLCAAAVVEVLASLAAPYAPSLSVHVPSDTGVKKRTE